MTPQKILCAVLWFVPPLCHSLPSNISTLPAGASTWISVGRAFFNTPISGVPEMVRLSIVAIVFLQAAHTLKVGRLTRAELIIDRVALRWPRINGGLTALYNLTGAALFLIILVAVYPSFVMAWRDDLFIGAEGDFTAPTWPTKLIVLIGCILVSIQFSILAWHELRKMLQRSVDNE